MHADGQPEEAVHPAHPLGVALGEVVVDRDDVDALAGERVEVGRQRRDEGLALTGLHLGDVAEVQRGAAHDLDVVVALAERAAGGLADGGERLGQQVVEGLAVGEPLPVLVGQRAQLGVGQLDVKPSSSALTCSAIFSSLRRILPSPARNRRSTMAATRVTPLVCRGRPDQHRVLAHRNQNRRCP